MPTLIVITYAIVVMSYQNVVMLAERQRAFVKRMHTVFVFYLARRVPFSIVVVNPHPWGPCSEARVERRIPLHTSGS